MRASVRLLLIVGLLGGLLLLSTGCAQNDDVVKPLNQAMITLEPTRLPQLDDSLYIYEMWAIKISASDDTTFTSLARFSWDAFLAVFKNPDGTLFDGEISLPEAYEAYDAMVLTVEPATDTDPDPSGVIILVGVTINLDPVDPFIDMGFPGFLFDASNAAYFVGTPTNTVTALPPDVTDPSPVTDDENLGLWLGARVESRHFQTDQLGIDSIVIDTTANFSGDSWDYFDTAYTQLITTDTVVFGLDTIFNRSRVEVFFDSVIDTLYDFNINIFYAEVEETFNYYAYSTPLEDLPDLQDYGWRYNTWILLEKVGPNADLDYPGMLPFAIQNPVPIVGDTNWVVIPLGGFFDFDGPDMSNPYIDSLEVPSLPGEDFLDTSLAAEKIPDLRLAAAEDATGGDWGSVILGIEPDPAKIEIDTTRNFPLFVMSAFLTSGLSASMEFPATPFAESMHNYSNYLPMMRVRVDFVEN